MNEHRVPMLGAALRRHADPARSTDPKVRELVAALAGLEVAPPPRAEFRAELRAQLVAVTPRLVAEGDSSAVEAAPARPRGAAAAPAERARRFRFAKPLIAAACALTVFVLLLGGAVLISQNALPGDALYGIKRASENTEYSLTGGQVAKGKLKLEFAARRIGEVADLLPRAASMGAATGAIADSGAINSETAGLVRDTLGSADGDVRTAAQLLGTNAVRNDAAGPLTAITSWTPGQLAAMRQIVARIPAGALHQRAVRTLDLVRAAQTRASVLRGELGCTCLDPARSDALGPLPCTGPCNARTSGTKPNPTAPATRPSRPGAPHGPGAPASSPAPGASTRAPGTSGPVTKSARPGAHPSSPAGGSSSTLPITAPTSPALPLPSLPGLGGATGGKTGGTNGSAHPPVTVNTCGASLDHGPIGIGVSGC